MDYRGYDPMLTSSRMPMTALPVPTISTGISLTDRFKMQQQQQPSVDRRYTDRSSDGYGLPEESRPHRYGQPRAAYIPSLVPNAVSIKNRQLALQLARSTSHAQQNALRPPRGINYRGKSIQSRLGIPRQRLGLAAGTVNRGGFRGVGRGGLKRLMPGRAQGLNQLQKTPAFINRAGSRGRFSGGNQGTRGQRGGIRGGMTRSRGASSARGGRGGNRNKSSQETPASKEALDEELDSYMSNSRAYLDKQLDDYMLKAKQAQAAATAGIAVIDEADVTMTDADATL